MPDHLITRAHRNLIDRSPPYLELPDPFHGLTTFHRLQLLTMAPSWSERWRMGDPKLTKEQKRDLLIDILFERRKAFDHEMELRIQQAQAQRREHRFRTGQTVPLPAGTLTTTAMKNMARQRQLRDQKELEIRDAYFRRRRDDARRQELASEHDDDEPRRRRGRGR